MSEPLSAVVNYCESSYSLFSSSFLEDMSLFVSLLLLEEQGGLLVTPERFELSTYRLEVSCSIQLSYGAKPFHCTRLCPPAGQIYEARSTRASDMAWVIAGTVIPYLSNRVALGTRSLNSLAAPKARVRTWEGP